MNLLLIRHAIAEEREVWNKSEKSDQFRPLTKKGQSRFTKAVCGMRKLVPNIHHLYVSQYTRALQTAEIIKGHYRVKHNHSIVELNPGISLEKLLNMIKARHLDETLCFVGHNPDLEIFLSFLLAGKEAPFIKMKKGSLAFIQTDDKESYRLSWHLTQKQLAML